MSKRIIAVAGLAAALTFALAAPAAYASSGAPSSPVSTNGQKVAGLKMSKDGVDVLKHGIGVDVLKHGIGVKV